MLKGKLAPAVLVLTLFVALSPAPSQAAPRWTAASKPVASLFTKIERWWNLFLNRQERPAAAGEKQGCAIDPHGQPLCANGSNTTQSEPPTTDSSGSN